MSKHIDDEDGEYKGSVSIDVYENTFDISMTNSLTFDDLYAIIYASLIYLESVFRDMEYVKTIKDKLH